MGFVINNNLVANNSYRSLNATQNDLSKSLEKLSTGLRINRAADDAAGLSISEGLKSQVTGSAQAARNAQDGISVIQTAEGALTEVHSILQRVRDLAVQAGNDSNNADSRLAITKEATALTDELTRISASTNFNGIQLLDGSAGALKFQVGADGNANSQITVDLAASANVKDVAGALTVGSAGAQINVLTPTDVTGPQSFSITNPDTSTSTVSVTLGAAGTYKTVQDVADALNASGTFNQALTASVNKDNQLEVRSLNGGTVVGGATAGTDAAAGTGLDVSAAVGAGALNFMSAVGAQNSIEAIDAQIRAVSDGRADLGAAQNRLEHTIKSLNVAGENLQAAQSRIADVDMAQEMVKFTKANILSQAGTAMLAQANQSSQGVLSLLR